MKKKILLKSATIDEKTLRSCSSVIAAFFPGSSVACLTERIETESPHVPALASNPEDCLVIHLERTGEQPEFLAAPARSLPGFEIRLITQDQDIRQKHKTDQIDPELRLPGKEELSQILVKRALFEFLRDYTERQNPWGILTGMRPGKLISKMEELGYGKEIQDKILKSYYLVSQEKIRLLQEVNRVQKPYIESAKAEDRKIALYAAIPFCPSRCYYCSFPSNPLTGGQYQLLDLYLASLHQEIRLTAEMMGEYGLSVSSLYVGGGTPTVLAPAQLQELLSQIRCQQLFSPETEYTVEAGRPDTLDPLKLEIMKEYGVNRISINPQTMQEQTLKRIGRTHGIAEFLECYEAARKISDWVINIDLIIGLPGEGPAEVIDSLRRILALRPDNLTLHALAVKRGSMAWENHYVHALDQQWDPVQEEIQSMILSSGYIPYYLYRQKNIAGNLENVGYCLPGKVCRYNIEMIEESRNIIGLGAAASSKLRRKDSGHENIYNPTDIKTYINRFSQIHEQRKMTIFDELMN